jgi:hypothetical protein
LPLDEWIAVQGLSPKLHWHKIPEISAFLDQMIELTRLLEGNGSSVPVKVIWYTSY